MEVVVRDNNVEQAFRKLKKKLHNEGDVRELMDRRYYEKPSDKKRRRHKDAVRRSKKELAKKQAKLFR